MRANYAQQAERRLYQERVMRNAMNMRIILQDQHSRRYFKAGNGWTAEIDDAMDFHQVVLAIDFARGLKLAHLNLLMYFGDPRYDVRLNLAEPVGDGLACDSASECSSVSSA